MNHFTKESIQLANQRNYLDLLFKVYPLNPDTIREIDDSLWTRIEQSYNNRDNKELFRALLDLDLFPIKDGYVPYFRRDRSAIDRNPDTVNRICGRIREMSLNQLYDKCSQPKETNRQMGPLFQRWLRQGVLGMNVVEVADFSEDMNNVILGGTDNILKQFAQDHLGYTRDKGIDFIAYRNKKYVIGIVVLITKTDTAYSPLIEECKNFIEDKNTLYLPLLIADGAIYSNTHFMLLNQLAKNNNPVISALLLREYLYSYGLDNGTY